MAYWEWGEPAQPDVVVCVHGLTRQGRDFDALAADLVTAGRRVVCPDVVGRGRSDWLSDPMGYTVPAYVADMVTLLARLDAERIDWVGTSMGGLIGIGVAALKGSPLRRLVLNDVGPRIQVEALQRIGAYLGQPARFADEQEAAQATWAISQSFGPHTPEEWLALTRPLLKPDGSGGLVFRYDPAIALPFRAITPELAAFGEAALWRAYDSLRLPTLLLRGAQSDLLSVDTAREMGQRGPRARLCEFDGVGHAPTLVRAEQRQVVRDFLIAP
jgi:pimeloyl-ACP methyl ester carboxylesterase